MYHFSRIPQMAIFSLALFLRFSKISLGKTKRTSSFLGAILKFLFLKENHIILSHRWKLLRLGQTTRGSGPQVTPESLPRVPACSQGCMGPLPPALPAQSQHTPITLCHQHKGSWVPAPSCARGEVGSEHPAHTGLAEDFSPVHPRHSNASAHRC